MRIEYNPENKHIDQWGYDPNVDLSTMEIVAKDAIKYS